jgi:hypothetical protein
MTTRTIYGNGGDDTDQVLSQRREISSARLTVDYRKGCIH